MIVGEEGLAGKAAHATEGGWQRRTGGTLGPCFPSHVYKVVV